MRSSFQHRREAGIQLLCVGLIAAVAACDQGRSERDATDSTAREKPAISEAAAARDAERGLEDHT